MSARPLSRRRFIITTSGTVGFFIGCGGQTPEAPPATAAPADAQPVDMLAQMRAQIGATPIQTVSLGDALAMLSGPGGNVVVLNGPDGKIVVDTFVQPAWDNLINALDGMGNQPIELLINTHWHFDHTDNNARFRKMGAEIIAHENTKKRLSEPHDLVGLHFAAALPEALPTQTFPGVHTMTVNGEGLELMHVLPAHTDTDICIRYTKANVVHMGDVFFNGMYPFIDAGTGGSISGMIAGADAGLKLADNSTKIAPGHGPLGNKAALTSYREMLVTVRDRVQKLKAGGQGLDQVLAAKPTADLDEVWGKGVMPPNDFVTIVYNTL
jgi:cyclase